jgi:hypothetical protein
MYSSAVPSLVKVTTLAGLVVPMVTVPKLRLVADSFTTELDEAIPLILNKRGF